MTFPASAVKVEKKKDDDSWGAWGSKPEEKKKVTTAMMNKKEPATAVLVDFNTPSPAAVPAKKNDGWDDWAFNK